MSQKRSGSLRGEVGEAGLELVGRTLQALDAVRRALYLVCWSAVRAGGGWGAWFGEGRMKGVRMGLVLPSQVAFSGVCSEEVEVMAVLRGRVELLVDGSWSIMEPFWSTA